jgi:hypothetical protein
LGEPVHGKKPEVENLVALSLYKLQLQFKQPAVAELNFKEVKSNDDKASFNF